MISWLRHEYAKNAASWFQTYFIIFDENTNVKLEKFVKYFQ